MRRASVPSRWRVRCSCGAAVVVPSRRVPRHDGGRSLVTSSSAVAAGVACEGGAALCRSQLHLWSPPHSSLTEKIKKMCFGEGFMGGREVSLPGAHAAFLTCERRCKNFRPCTSFSHLPATRANFHFRFGSSTRRAGDRRFGGGPGAAARGCHRKSWTTFIDSKKARSKCTKEAKTTQREGVKEARQVGSTCL